MSEKPEEKKGNQVKPGIAGVSKKCRHRFEARVRFIQPNMSGQIFIDTKHSIHPHSAYSTPIVRKRLGACFTIAK